jgi:hypothetical protein
MPKIPNDRRKSTREAEQKITKIPNDRRKCTRKAEQKITRHPYNAPAPQRHKLDNL